jgi:hypothetical protein
MVEAFGDDMTDAQLKVIPYYMLCGRIFQRIVNGVGRNRVGHA